MATDAPLQVPAGDESEVFAQVAEFPPLSPPASTPSEAPLDFFMDVPVTVTARLGEVVKPIGELLKLGPGAVIELDRDVSQPVDLVVRGVVFARGEVVVVDDQFAVRIKELLTPRRPGWCEMMRYAGLAAAVICAVPAIAAAQAAGDWTYQPPAAPAALSPGPLVLRLLALSVVVLAVCGGVRWLARSGRWAARLPGNGAGRLSHITSVALDRRCSLHLLRAGSRRVVLGLDPTGLKSMVLLPESFVGALDAEKFPADDTLARLDVSR